MDSCVNVVPSCNGPMTNECIKAPDPTNRVLPAWAICEVRGNLPFWFLVFRFSETPVALPQNMLIAVGPERPEIIMETDKLDPTLETDRNAIDYKTQKIDRRKQTQTERYEQGSTGDEKKIDIWRQ